MKCRLGWLLALPVAMVLRGEDLTLGNDVAELRFSERHAYALSSIVDRRTGTTFRFGLADRASLWALRRLVDGLPSDIVGAGAPTSVSRHGEALTFVWPEARLEVALPRGSGIAEWRFSWKGTGPWPYSFDYPLAKVRKVGAADRLYYPQRLGKVLEDPVGRDFGVIPISPNWWSSQLVLLSASPSAPRHRDEAPDRLGIDGFIRGARPDESTLYLSADDSAFWRKEVVLSGRKGATAFELGLRHYPPWKDVPGKPSDANGAFAWSAPYVVRFGVISGGVDRGVDVYRTQSRGRIPQDWRPSPLVVDRPAWRSIHLPLAEITRVGRNMRDYYRVPVVLHHYENTLERFNFHFSEFLSYKSHFREENEYLRSIGCAVMPYFNVVRFDRTLGSYARLDGDSTALRELHTRMNMYVMRAGKHVFTDVPGGMTIEECWENVETAEETRRHCMMLENYCYNETVLLAMNLAASGRLGEVVHARCGYVHDQRDLFRREPSRAKDSVNRPGNWYPTHGIGPAALSLNINRGDRLDYLVSLETDSVSFVEYIGRAIPKDDRKVNVRMRHGDLNTTLIRTTKGHSIFIEHDVSLARPHSYLNLVSGTRGSIRCQPDLRISLEGPDGPPKNALMTWMNEADTERIRRAYMHPMWREGGDLGKYLDGGHWGGDFLMDNRWAYCLKHGLPLDLSVYDLATWSSLVELTRRSVENRSEPVDVPDFTRGGWKTAKPFPVVSVPRAFLPSADSSHWGELPQV